VDKDNDVMELMRGMTLAMCAAAMLAAFSARAAPCAVLQYEEMKDMSAEELTKEYCKAKSTASENLSNSIDKGFERHQTTEDEAAIRMLDKETTQCTNESERVSRVLARKGVTIPSDWYHGLCKDS
jgi:hypothetical protein